MATWLAFGDNAIRIDHDHSCFYGISWGPKDELKHAEFENFGACVDQMSRLASMRIPFEVFELMDGESNCIGRTVLDGDEYYGDVKLWGKDLMWKTHQEQPVDNEITTTLS